MDEILGLLAISIPCILLETAVCTYSSYSLIRNLVPHRGVQNIMS